MLNLQNLYIKTAFAHSFATFAIPVNGHGSRLSIMQRDEPIDGRMVVVRQCPRLVLLGSRETAVECSFGALEMAEIAIFGCQFA
ncbi:hypothetical protein WK13_32725 [Burkholderia ubonensis]|nr:hypothetical protein WK13_32725 [Burkholderia ubonensis]